MYQTLMDTITWHDYFWRASESYWKDGDKATRISQFTCNDYGRFLENMIVSSMIADDFKLLP